ncbi:MAG TPA: HEAT repeat domain-containing protein [Longimicrobium sp.]|jgi:hypothetical protein|uniref:HEAT repeat domain-containing protein n=1 Tax=Longimicrobium sp. TaxID=2029185 RepID=UPI002EDA5105
MPQTHRSRPLLHAARAAFAVAGTAALGACAGAGSASAYGPRPLVNDVVQLLDVSEPSPAYYRDRARLEVLGPELDAVLIRLIEDPGVDAAVRANAVVLLADRRAPGSLDLLRRQLSSSGSDEVRAAAARGLQNFLPDSAPARNALRAAAGDPSSAVRLTVLQRLDVEDAPLVRAILPGEENGQVRTIAQQLLTLLEARGAPLARDERGDLRTTGPADGPRIVFHATWTDSVAQLQAGALWVQMPDSRLVPLGQEVEVVADVVPGFFDPTRTVVVYEADREIRMRDLRSGTTRTVGRGVAPRVVPFTEEFVFVREVPGARTVAADGGVLMEYEVLRSSFGDEAPRVIGRLTATSRTETRGGASPVRWMVVGEGREGFVLRGPGITPFPLAGPFEQGAPRP